jgi:protein involved in sex pheromone biosynthesis
MKKHIALGLVASTLFLAGCCTSHHVAQWEYREASGMGEVNQLAAQGWTVVGYSTSDYDNGQSSGHYQHFLLKRPKQ